MLYWNYEEQRLQLVKPKTKYKPKTAGEIWWAKRTKRFHKFKFSGSVYTTDKKECAESTTASPPSPSEEVTSRPDKTSRGRARHYQFKYTTGYKATVQGYYRVTYLLFKGHLPYKNK
jgi:hypothetical protein